MHMQRRFYLIFAAAIFSWTWVHSQDKAPTTASTTTVQDSTLKSTPAEEGSAVMGKNKIRRNAKVFVTPMESGFDNFVIAGLQKKEVPLVVVTNRDKADYEIAGVSDSEKAGWAKMLFLGSQQSKEQASIKVIDLKTNEIVFGYSVHKGNSYRGRQSAGEACAKHIKEVIASN
jgi:hypothetical protein